MMWEPGQGGPPGEVLGWFRLESLLQELVSVIFCTSVTEAANPDSL